VETIGSKRSYALTWCMPNNDDDDDDDVSMLSCQVDGCHLKSTAELDELCLCKDTASTGMFFCELNYFTSVSTKNGELHISFCILRNIKSFTQPFGKVVS